MSCLLNAVYNLFSCCRKSKVAAKSTSVVYKGNNINVIYPEKQLAPDSLQIVTSNDLGPFFHTLEDMYGGAIYETQSVINRITNVWKKYQKTSYLIFGIHRSKQLFYWEIVPYSKSNRCGSFFAQLRVLWNTIFGGRTYQINQKMMVDLTSALSTQEPESQKLSEQRKHLHPSDAFCNKQVISRQLVFQDTEINVLYNHAPLQYYHFLLVPIEHRESFSDLTESENWQVIKLVQKISSYFSRHTLFIFHKTGKEAGQTVKHWHMHLVFSENSTQTLVGKSKIFINMTLGSSPLKETVVKHRVQEIQKKLRINLNTSQSPLFFKNS